MCVVQDNIRREYRRKDRNKIQRKENLESKGEKNVYRAGE
jgi:hypothetical protein